MIYQLLSLTDQLLNKVPSIKYNNTELHNSSHSAIAFKASFICINCSVICNCIKNIWRVIYQLYWFIQINKDITILMFKLKSKLLRQSCLWHSPQSKKWWFQLLPYCFDNEQQMEWFHYWAYLVKNLFLEKSIWNILNFVAALQSLPKKYYKCFYFISKCSVSALHPLMTPL